MIAVNWLCVDMYIEMGSPLSFNFWRAFTDLCSFVIACAHTRNYK